MPDDDNIPTIPVSEEPNDSSDTEPTEPTDDENPPISVLVIYDPEQGFQSTIDPRVNPIILAGIGWYIMELAAINFGNQVAQSMMEEQQNRQQRRRLHLPGSRGIVQ